MCRTISSISNTCALPSEEIAGKGFLNPYSTIWKTEAKLK